MWMPPAAKQDDDTLLSFAEEQLIERPWKEEIEMSTLFQ
jgi:hypothetical protein